MPQGPQKQPGATARGTLSDKFNDDIIVRVAKFETIPQLIAGEGRLDRMAANVAATARNAIVGGGFMDSAHDIDAMPPFAASALDSTEAGLFPPSYVATGVGDADAGMAREALDSAVEPLAAMKLPGRDAAMTRGLAGRSDRTLLSGSAAAQGAIAGLYRPQAPAPAERAAGNSPTSGARKARIVLVDDDPEILDVLGEILASCGYNVQNFCDAVVALEHLGGEEPADLLITDLTMPGTNGLALIREAQQRQPGLPAILLTGYSAAELGLTTGRLATGHLLLLQKPVRTIEFMKQVAAVLVSVGIPT